VARDPPNMDKLIDQLKISCFALQVDEMTDVLVKDAHVITLVQYVLENDIKKEFLF